MMTPGPSCSEELEIASPSRRVSHLCANLLALVLFERGRTSGGLPSLALLPPCTPAQNLTA